MLTDSVLALRKLAKREDLTSSEVRDTLNILMTEEEDFYFTLAFAMGLMAKGPTVQELKGFILSFNDRSIKLTPNVDSDLLIDVSGTGGDTIKTPNIGTASSFVLAAGGLIVGKQSTRGYTGTTGSRDIFVAFGVDIPLSKGDPHKVERALEEIGLFPFYYPSFSDAFTKRVGFFTKLKELGLTFVTPWHLTSWVFSPLPIKHRVYGMFSDEYLESFSNLYKELGYKHAMVVHGVDGLDEMSNIGPTKISELINGDVVSYIVTPDDLGVRQAKQSEIASNGAEENILDFLRILYGKEKGAKTDLVAINSGAAFYAANKVTDLKSGTRLAFKLIENGSAYQKLEELISYSGEQKLLDYYRMKAGL